MCGMTRGGDAASLYHSSQFAPLIIFFLMFLAVVKNSKLHHFVRFNAMQVRPQAVASGSPRSPALAAATR